MVNGPAPLSAGFKGATAPGPRTFGNAEGAPHLRKNRKKLQENI